MEPSQLGTVGAAMRGVIGIVFSLSIFSSFHPVKERQVLQVWPSTATDAPPTIEYPLHQTIERDLALPREWVFGFNSNERAYLFFPSFAPQPHLWEQLKRARSVKELRAATGEIYDWLTAAAPGVTRMPEFRAALHDGAGELLKARDLWNYPRKQRPSSDDKRVEFFAEALAGLMLGLAPATATKKLSRWNPPKLWLTRFESCASLA